MPDKIEEFFTDTISRVDFIGGMIRLELSTLTPSATPEAQPQLQPRRTAIMPLEGFLHAHDVMLDLLEKLKKAGIVTKKEKT